MNNIPFSITWQIIEDCDRDCPICHRRCEQENPLSFQEQQKVIDFFASVGINRICITGGEPTLDNNIFDLLEYIHNNRIHTCLSTHGLLLTPNKVRRMDAFLDQILLPIRNLSSRREYKLSNGKCAGQLDPLLPLLNWLKSSSIIIEVATVVSKINYDEILALGNELLSINSEIVWRVEEYYANGIYVHDKKRYELSDKEFYDLTEKIRCNFNNKFKALSFSAKSSRFISPDFMITPYGNLVTTSKNKTEIIGHYNQLKALYQGERRDCKDYNKAFREWGW